MHQTIVRLCASKKRMFVGGECMYNRVYNYIHFSLPNNVSIIKLTLNLCMHASTPVELCYAHRELCSVIVDHSLKCHPLVQSVSMTGQVSAFAHLWV